MIIGAAGAAFAAWAAVLAPVGAASALVGASTASVVRSTAAATDGVAAAPTQTQVVPVMKFTALKVGQLYLLRLRQHLSQRKMLRGVLVASATCKTAPGDVFAALRLTGW